MHHRNGTVGKSAHSIGSGKSSRRVHHEQFQEVQSNFLQSIGDELPECSLDEILNELPSDPTEANTYLSNEVRRLRRTEQEKTHENLVLSSKLDKAQRKLVFSEEMVTRLKMQLEDEKQSHQSTRLQLEEIQKMLPDTTASLRPTPMTTPEQSTPEQAIMMNELIDKIKTLEQSVQVLMAEKQERQMNNSPVVDQSPKCKEEDHNHNKVFLTTESNEKDGDDSENYDYYPTYSLGLDQPSCNKVEPKAATLKMNPQLKKAVPQTIDIRRHSRSKTMFSEPIMMEGPRKRNSRMMSEIESGLDTYRNTISKGNLEEKTPSNENESVSNHDIHFERLGKSNIFTHQAMLVKTNIDFNQKKLVNPKGLVIGKDDYVTAELGKLSSRCASSRQIGNKVKPINLTIDNNSSRRPSFTVHSTTGNTKEIQDLRLGKYSCNLNVPGSRSTLHIDEFFSGGGDHRFKSLTKLDKAGSEMPKGNNSQSGFSKFMYKGTKDPRKRLGMASDKKYTHASCHLDLIK